MAEVVVDDMPFLVDSASMVIAENGLALHLLVHPQFVVRRDVTGALQEVLSEEKAADSLDTEHDLVRESWMHLEIDRIADPAEHRRLEAELQSVLTDVREAVEDWPKMHEKALSIAAGLDAAELPVGENEVAEAKELLDWLADEHFTFLGYREYSFSMDGETGVLRGIPGTGLGILRARPQARRRPAAARGQRPGPRAQAADPDQGELPVHRAPLVVPGLRRDQAVRRER